jgi:hypothetical protein
MILKLKTKLIVIMSSNKSEYYRAISICEEWLDNYSSPHKCGGRNLLNTIKNIIDERPAFCIKDTRPFGDLLDKIEEGNLLILMKVLLGHINNPNFMLRSGNHQGKTLLQGAIASDNKLLVKLLLSNTHGSKIHEIKEPLIIDYQTYLWLQS